MTVVLKHAWVARAYAPVVISKTVRARQNHTIHTYTRQGHSIHSACTVTDGWRRTRGKCKKGAVQMCSIRVYVYAHACVQVYILSYIYIRVQ